MIIKSLKGYTFTYHPEVKLLQIEDRIDDITITMDRVKMGALSRFIFSCMQYHYPKKKEVKK